MEPSDLIERVWPDAYRIAYSILDNHADAEDAAQDACARMHVSLHQLRNEAAFPQWFYRIVVNAARERARRRPGHVPLVESAVPSARAVEPDRLDMLDAIAALPTSQRMAVIFRYHYGFSDAEVAKILSTTHAAIRVRLFMARRSLRRSLLDDSGIVEKNGEIIHERS